MSRSRDLANFGSTTADVTDLNYAKTLYDTGVTGAEFDQLDTTSGIPGAGNFLRGDKTWASPGLDGVTTGSGNVTITDGNLILDAGNGIDFSDTTNTGETGASMTSELLDDYEEGTWTPSFGTSGTHGTNTMTVNSIVGQYVKVGRLVRVNFQGQRADSGTWSSGDLYLRNMPFTSNNVANLAGHCWLDTGSGDGYKCFFYSGGNSTSFTFSHGSTPSTASRYVSPPDTYFANNWYLYGSITYTALT